MAAICLDFDGTLVDSEPLHYEAWYAELLPLGVQLAEAEYLAHFCGISTADTAAALVARHGLSIAPEQLKAQKMARFAQLLSQKWPPKVAQADAFLAELSRLGVPLALVMWDDVTDTVTSTTASPDGGLVVETVLRDAGGFGMGWQAGLVRVRPTDPRRRAGWTTVASFSPEGLDVLAAPEWTAGGALRLRFSRPLTLVEGPIDADGRPTLVCMPAPAPAAGDDCRSSQAANPAPAAASASPTASIPSATR